MKPLFSILFILAEMEVYLGLGAESRSEEIRRDFLHRSSLDASPSARSLVYWLLGLLLFPRVGFHCVLSTHDILH